MVKNLPMADGHPERVVIVGTGTDVGKTHVTTALLWFLRTCPVRVTAWKPIASGVEGECEDSLSHAQAVVQGCHVEPPMYAFREAISPHLAARREGVQIDLSAVRKRAFAIRAQCECVLIESAGGLFSPLGGTSSNTCVSNVDLVRALAPAVVLLVAPDRLGVLHDVRATLLAARSMSVHLDALVLSAPSVTDASTGTNAAELGALCGMPVAATFARAEPNDRRSAQAAAAAWEALSQQCFLS